ncbi:MAG: VOC family protein [Colwellia sp.]|nr:VOC family protein [Colwellia sp.]MCW8866285.1 VOC family protein [Colwellia sp.]MCW9081499.1 VOC family protein [Colwellia sp.]
MYGNQIGDMAWMDLSVPDAEQVKRFYQKVLGWQSESVSMSDDGESYEDFAMSSQEEAPSSETSSDRFVTGVCHSKGANADMPSVWLPYFLVADIDVAVATVKAEGGELTTKIKSMGDDRYVVVKDPSGAQCALYQKSN